MMLMPMRTFVGLRGQPRDQRHALEPLAARDHRHARREVGHHAERELQLLAVRRLRDDDAVERPDRVEVEVLGEGGEVLELLDRHLVAEVRQVQRELHRSVLSQAASATTDERARARAQRRLRADPQRTHQRSLSTGAARRGGRPTVDRMAADRGRRAVSADPRSASRRPRCAPTWTGWSNAKDARSPTTTRCGRGRSRTSTGSGRSIVDYYDIAFSTPWTQVRTADPMPHTRWFTGAPAELGRARAAPRRRRRRPRWCACRRAARPAREISRGELRRSVAAVAGVAARAPGCVPATGSRPTCPTPSTP